MIDLSNLEAKARAATNGEWSVLTSSLDSTRSIMAGDPAFFLARCHKSPVSDATANAAYIVAAQPSVVLELIERIRAAEAGADEDAIYGYALESKDGFRELHSTADIAARRADPGETIVTLYAAPVDTAALVDRVTTLEKALGDALNVIATAGPTQTHDHVSDRKLLNSTVARVAGILTAALGGSNE